MRSRFAMTAAAVAVAVVTSFASSAWARPDRRTPYAWGHAYRHGWYGGTYRPGWSYGHRNGWYGSSSPPGWNRGRKRGWGGRLYPPGWYRH